jgi:hypothetical protein
MPTLPQTQRPSWEHDVYKRLARHVELHAFDAAASAPNVKDAPTKAARVSMWLRNAVSDTPETTAELLVKVL